MKLSIKLALYITLIAVVLAALVSVISYVSVQERVTHSSDSAIDSLTQTVSSMAATAAYIEDSELANEVVRGLQINDVVSCARLTTASMSVSSPDDCDQGAAYRQLDVSSPWDENDKVGQLDLWLNEAFVESQARSQVYFAALVLLSVIAVISAAIALITVIVVTRPISAISNQLAAVDFGKDFTLLNEATRKDELGNIARVINLMLVNAKKQIITEKLMVRRTEEISKHMQLIYHLSTNFLAVTDERLMLRSCNPKFEALVKGACGDERSILNSDRWVEAFSEDAESLRNRVLAHPDFDQPCSMELEVDSGDNDVLDKRYFKFTFVKILVEGHEASIFIYILDVTDHKRKLARTEYEANHDNLTKLYNRLAATRKIRRLLTSHDLDQRIAVLFIDLDGFKAVNDTLGHDAGDELLKVVASRLRNSVRRSDIAARWGGDEFLVALDGVDEGQAENVARKILAAIVDPINVKNDKGELVKANVGASIGIALSNNERGDFSTLYDMADRAMYRVKKAGKNNVIIATEEDVCG